MNEHRRHLPLRDAAQRERPRGPAGAAACVKVRWLQTWRKPRRGMPAQTGV